MSYGRLVMIVAVLLSCFWCNSAGPIRFALSLAPLSAAITFWLVTGFARGRGGRPAGADVLRIVSWMVLAAALGVAIWVEGWVYQRYWAAYTDVLRGPALGVAGICVFIIVVTAVIQPPRRRYPHGFCQECGCATKAWERGNA